MNDRGHYGTNGVPRIGQDPRAATIYVEREPTSTSKWILGVLAIGSALWTRHQSKQIEQLYKQVGLPYQSFASSLRESARALSARARGALRGFTQPATKDNEKR